MKTTSSKVRITLDRNMLHPLPVLSFGKKKKCCKKYKKGKRCKSCPDD
jgi:hypothetical protein